MQLVVARLIVLAGATAFIVGGIAGWYSQPFPRLPAPRAHEFAGPVGEWAWLPVAPMLAAAFAPYRAAWSRWLWVTALAPLLAAVVVLRIDAISLVTFPFFPPLGERSAWLYGSAAGAFVALVGLIAVRVLVARGTTDPLTGGWQVPAVVAVMALSAIAVPFARGSRDAGLERRVAKEVSGQCRGADVRVECRDRLGRPMWCAWEVRCPDGSRSGGSGADGAIYAPATAS